MVRRVKKKVLDRAARCAALAIVAAPLALAPATAAADAARWRIGLAAEAGRGDGTDTQRLAFVAAQTAPLWTRGAASFTAFGEIAVAQWRFAPPDASARRRITVVGFTPYLRLRDARSARWFFDFGIGVNTLSDLYETTDRRFSTRFQFNDHLGVGRGFGDGHSVELSYRFVLYSNAGIRRPNPGANFHVLRLEYRWP
jgi:lipid A 3-O-deacylase